MHTSLLTETRSFCKCGELLAERRAQSTSLTLSKYINKSRTLKESRQPLDPPASKILRENRYKSQRPAGVLKMYICNHKGQRTVQYIYIGIATYLQNMQFLQRSQKTKRNSSKNETKKGNLRKKRRNLQADILEITSKSEKPETWPPTSNARKPVQLTIFNVSSSGHRDTNCSKTAGATSTL